eukprot:PRCOL_00005553-RA
MLRAALGVTAVARDAVERPAELEARVTEAADSLAEALQRPGDPAERAVAALGVAAAQVDALAARADEAEGGLAELAAGLPGLSELEGLGGAVEAAFEQAGVPVPPSPPFPFPSSPGGTSASTAAGGAADATARGNPKASLTEEETLAARQAAAGITATREAVGAARKAADNAAGKSAPMQRIAVSDASKRLRSRLAELEATNVERAGAAELAPAVSAAVDAGRELLRELEELQDALTDAARRSAP